MPSIKSSLVRVRGSNCNKVEEPSAFSVPSMLAIWPTVALHGEFPMTQFGEPIVLDVSVEVTEPRVAVCTVRWCSRNGGHDSGHILNVIQLARRQSGSGRRQGTAVSTLAAVKLHACHCLRHWIHRQGVAKLTTTRKPGLLVSRQCQEKLDVVGVAAPL